MAKSDSVEPVHPIDWFRTDCELAFSTLTMDIAQFQGRPRFASQDALDRGVEAYLARVANAGRMYFERLKVND